MAEEADVVISTGGISVSIWCTKLDHNLDKSLISVELPRPEDTMNTDLVKDVDDAISSWDSWLIDIGRVKEIITVQGMLIDESTESALEKKKKLFNIVGNGKEINISWGTGSNLQTRNGNVTKLMVTETPGIIGVQKSGYYSEKNFAVQLAFQEGTNK